MPNHDRIGSGSMTVSPYDDRCAVCPVRLSNPSRACCKVEPVEEFHPKRCKAFVDRQELITLYVRKKHATTDQEVICDMLVKSVIDPLGSLGYCRY